MRRGCFGSGVRDICRGELELSSGAMHWGARMGVIWGRFVVRWFHN